MPPPSSPQPKPLPTGAAPRVEPGARLDRTRRGLLVLAISGIVQCAAPPNTNARRGASTPGAKAPGPASVQPAVIIGHDPAKLPQQVADMRFAILSAVERGDIGELRYAIDINELKPDFGAPPGTEPIAHLIARSGDGAGREILAILGRLLDSGWAAVPGGTDVENNRIYVWPYFAEVPLADLKPAEEVALYRLVSPAQARAMKAAGRWMWWRLMIGADGVWHSFTRSS